MSEYNACLDCPGACCKAPLANHSNMDNFGEIRKLSAEPDIQAVVERIMSIVLESKLRMSGAELKLLGIMLNIEETSPGLIIVLWHIQFECLYLSDEGQCLNYESRPKICRDYACSTVAPDDHRPTQQDLIFMNMEIQNINWADMPKHPEVLKADLQARAKEAFDK